MSFGIEDLGSPIRQAETVQAVKQMIRDEETIRRRDGVFRDDEILSRQFAGLKHINLYETRRENEELAYKFFNFLATILAPTNTAIYQKSLKFCRENGLKALGEDTNTFGGALVPPELDRMLIRLVERNGVFRRNARVRLMTRDLRAMPRRTGGATVGWAVEGGTITESQPSFDNVNLAAKKLIALCIASSELIEDAAISIADEIGFEIGIAFARAEDQAGFVGDGSPTYGGITGATQKLKGLSATIANIAGVVVASGNLFSEFVLGDFVKVAALLPDYADTPSTAWYCHRNFYYGTVVPLVLAAAGAAASSLAGVSPDGLPLFLGLPVNFTNAMPKTDANSQIPILLGDLSLAATLGDRRTRTLFTDPYTLSGNDQVQMRGTERADIVIHEVGNATSVAADKAPGAIVGLISAAS